ncbi:MAG: efflux RND transporter periplasmic adaptor subunit [Burkholderiales bacterium]|nr:efflux RND transporter periplasmic adaptor subunit [Burkholderiales bacterium]MCE7878545.1 efflux RND transporter periplasmic adaptor subunit [Betaproteobacteria bacterium PRO3]
MRAFAAALALAVAVPANGEGSLATLRVGEQSARQTVPAEAVVEAVRQATLASQVAGRIVDLPVKAGDAVRAGQVLARIDARAADAAVVASRSQLAEAQANYANAKRVHERNVALLAQKFVSQAAVDQSATALASAAAQVEAVRANLGSADVARDWTTIVAPYAGIVGATHAELGDMATPGKPIVTVFDPRELRAVATVPQVVLAKADLAASRVELPASGRMVTPVRATVVPLADARSHTTSVRFDLPPVDGVVPGQYARVRLAVGVATLLAVPESALVRRGEVTAVYVIDAKGTPRLRQVRVGSAVGEGEVEVLAGLAAGDTIAANPVAAGMRTKAP